MAKRTSMARRQVFEERTDIFRFLELPGEIRNAIYNYCEPTAPQNFVHSHEGDHQYPEHTVFNLAGVNKQLRSEFLPLCQNGFTHRVQFADLPAYAQTFIAPHSAISGTININVKAEIKKGVDILSLMTLDRKYGSLRHKIKQFFAFMFSLFFRSETAERRQARILSNLLAHALSPSNDKWVAYASKAVLNVIVSSIGVDLEIQVVVKKSQKSGGWVGTMRVVTPR
jgi:hypothetical protein